MRRRIGLIGTTSSSRSPLKLDLRLSRRAPAAGASSAARPLATGGAGSAALPAAAIVCSRGAFVQARRGATSVATFGLCDGRLAARPALSPSPCSFSFVAAAFASAARFRCFGGASSPAPRRPPPCSRSPRRRRPSRPACLSTFDDSPGDRAPAARPWPCRFRSRRALSSLRGLLAFAASATGRSALR